MSDIPTDVDRLLRLAEEVCAETASAEELAALDTFLLSDSAARRHYLDYCRMHMAIGLELQAEREVERLCRTIEVESASADLHTIRSAAIHSCPVVPILSPQPAPWSPLLQGSPGFLSSGWPVAYLIATVFFGIGLTVAAIVHVSRPRPIVQHAASPTSPSSASVIGRVTGMVDCVWEASGDGVHTTDASNQEPEIGNRKSTIHLGDRLAFKSGLLEITYDTGAKVILEGPAAYEVESSAGGYLSIGRLTARLEKRSELRDQRSELAGQKSESINHESFSVRTPTAVVTDLGTEFGVAVNEKGRTEVHVLQGLVETRRLGRLSTSVVVKRLHEGMAVQIGRENEPIETVRFAPRSFIRSLPTRFETPAETAYMDAVLADKPVGYWPLNEPAGSRKFLDRSGNGIHGYAMRELRAGVPGPLSNGSRAVAFDGKGYIDFGGRDQFALKNDITIEAWVWIGDVQPSSHIISILGRGGDGYIGWGLFAGRRKDLDVTNAANPIVPYLIGYDVQRFPFSLSAGESIENRWLHLAAAFDSSNTAHLYLNGVCRGSLAANKPGSVGPVWLQIGGAELIDEDFWRGRIAHVAIYPRALRAERILNHYNQRGNSEKEVPNRQNP